MTTFQLGWTLAFSNNFNEFSLPPLSLCWRRKSFPNKETVFFSKSPAALPRGDSYSWSNRQFEKTRWLPWRPPYCCAWNLGRARVNTTPVSFHPLSMNRTGNEHTISGASGEGRAGTISTMMCLERERWEGDSWLGRDWRLRRHRVQEMVLFCLFVFFLQSDHLLFRLFEESSQTKWWLCLFLSSKRRAPSPPPPPLKSALLRYKHSTHHQDFVVYKMRQNMKE